MNELIKKWRKEAGMTQKELAEKLFLTPPAISQYESGKREVSVPVLQKIATIFNKSISVQLTEENIVQKITPELIENTLKPLFLDIPGIINVDEEDFYHFFSIKGEHYYLQTKDQNPFSATLDLFVDFIKEKDLKEGKGIVAHIQGGLNFSYEHLDFFSEQIHKRVNQDTNILVGINIDDSLEEFQLILCAFGFDK